MKRELLPPRALKGVRVGISVSGSADLDRLGLLESHFRLALGEIARCVLLSGGQIAYGGHLDPGGYTAFLVQELHRYGRRDRPLHVYLAWQEHRKLSVGEISAQKKLLGLYGDITCLDVDGRPIDPVANRSKDPVPELDESVRSRSLTSLRLYMARKTSARILIGGRHKGFEGNMPGPRRRSDYCTEGRPACLSGRWIRRRDAGYPQDPGCGRWIVASGESRHVSSRPPPGGELGCTEGCRKSAELDRAEKWP